MPKKLDELRKNGTISEEEYQREKDKIFSQTENPPTQNVTGTPPKTWLLESILVTLFCCLPFGIAGIVNAANVEKRFYAGDVAGAERASAEAGKWTKISFWLGIAGIIIYVILMAFGVVAGIHNRTSL